MAALPLPLVLLAPSHAAVAWALLGTVLVLAAWGGLRLHRRLNHAREALAVQEAQTGAREDLIHALMASHGPTQGGVLIARASDGRILEANEALLEMAGRTALQALPDLWTLLSLDPNTAAKAQARADPITQRTILRRADTSTPEVTISLASIAPAEDPLLAVHVVERTPAEAAEQGRRSAEHAWQRIAEAVPNLVARIDRTGRVTFLNQPLPGTTRDAARGTAFHEHVIDADKERVEQAIARVLRTGETLTLTFRLATPEGPSDPHEARLAPVREGDRIVQASLVTLQKGGTEQAEEARQETEAFLHATLDSLSSAIAILDTHGRVTAANKAWRHGANGILPDGHIREVGGDLIQVLDQAEGPGAADRHAVAQGIRAVMTGQEPDFLREYRTRTQRGPRWVQVRVTPFRGEARRGAVVSYEDITERKQAEKEHHRASEQFEVAVGELSRSVGAAADPEEVAERLVDAVLRVSTVRGALVINHQGLVSLRARSEEEREQAREKLHNDPGSFQWVSASLPDAEEPVNLLLMPDGEEISEAELKKIEILSTQAALALQRAEVLERIRAAYDRLDRSLMQKQVFMDVLSHDLKNPLAVARGRIELIGMKHPQVQEDLETVEKSLDRADQLIEKAVLYSQLEEQEEIERGERDVVSMAWEVVDALTPLAEQRGIEIVVEGPDLMVYPAHPMLGRAIENLISNAIKWSPEDGTVKVHLEDLGDAGRINVVDHGPGIPPEERRKLFSRFQRVDRSGVQGTGLGLAIAKRIVEMHNGDIRAEETPGGGSTFVIELPREHAVPVETQDQEPAFDMEDTTSRFGELSEGA